MAGGRHFQMAALAQTGHPAGKILLKRVLSWALPPYGVLRWGLPFERPPPPPNRFDIERLTLETSRRLHTRHLAKVTAGTELAA